MRYLAFILLFSFAATLPAQTYKTAVGIRVDNGINITAQQYLLKNLTLEGILHAPFNEEKTGVTLLLEQHRKIVVRNINVYAGGGGHLYWNMPIPGETNGATKNVYGLSGIAGAELSLGNLNFAADWKPELHFSGVESNAFSASGFSFSMRYIIAKRSRTKIKDWGVWDKIHLPKKKK